MERLAPRRDPAPGGRVPGRDGERIGLPEGTVSSASCAGLLGAVAGALLSDDGIGWPRGCVRLTQADVWWLAVVQVPVAGAEASVGLT